MSTKSVNSGKSTRRIAGSGRVAPREPRAASLPLPEIKVTETVELAESEHSGPGERVGDPTDGATSGSGVLSAGGGRLSVGNQSGASSSEAARRRNEGLRGATERAARVVDEVKTALESKAASNLKREVRDLVIDSLYLMQTLVYRLADSRNLLYEEVESGRARADCREARRHARELEAVLADYRALGGEVGAVRADTAAIREHMASARDPGGERAAADGGAAAQLERLTREVAALRDHEPRSYAEVARVAPPPRAAHTLIVSSRDPRHTADDVMRQIESAVDARGAGVRVERCRRARDGKVVLGCAERADVDKLAERLRARAADLAVEEAWTRRCSRRT